MERWLCLGLLAERGRGTGDTGSAAVLEVYWYHVDITGSDFLALPARM